ncbi:MAG: hypothetical protein ACYC6T_05930 [Thermoleophilia bacterium]
MSALDHQRMVTDHSDEGLVQILRALGATGCTGSLAVASADNAGVIFMEDGWVVDALVTDGSWLGEGVPAVAFLANLVFPELEFSEATDFSRRTIRLDMDRLEDMVEQVRPLLLSSEQTSSNESRDTALTPHPETPAAGPDTTAVAVDEPDVEPNTVEEAETPQAEEEEPVDAQDLFTTLRSVIGYMAAAIVDDSGTVLAEDSTGGAVDLGTVSPVFAQIFRLTRETTAEIGLGACAELTTATPFGTIIARCSATNPPEYILCILAPRGNTALAKLRLDAYLSTSGNRP